MAARRPTVSVTKTSALLRASLSFVFAYAGVTMLMAPEGYLEYIPVLVEGWMPSMALLRAFGAYELVLVAGLLSRRRVASAALASGVTLIAIVAVNPDSFDVLFRNVAIAGAAAALFVEERRASSYDQAAESVASTPADGLAPDPVPLPSRHGRPAHYAVGRP